MSHTTNMSSSELFHSLEESESRKGAFGLSVVVHLVVLTTVLAVPLVFTGTVKLRHQMVMISLPPAESPSTEVIEWNEPAPKMPYVEPERLREPPPQDPVLTTEALTQPEPVKPDPIPLPKVVEPEPIPVLAPVVRTVEIRPETPAPIAPPKLGVVTNVFSADTAAKATNLPEREIQTSSFSAVSESAVARGNRAPASATASSGFGAVNGTTAARGSRAPASATASSGFGAVNGTSAVRGSRAPASAVSGGFEGVSGAARGAPSKAEVDRSIRQGGFANAEPASPGQVPRKRDDQPTDIPAEVTFKPRPDYTEEARRLRLEGEVVLRVLFSGAGEVRILALVRGLGHGLDENAMTAAQRIRFKPAVRNGEPIDSTATVHIAFQLAY